MCTCICLLHIVLVGNIVSLISPTDVGGSEVVVPGGDGPPPVVLVGVGIGVLLLLCFLLGLLAFCVLCCFVKKSQRRKKGKAGNVLLNC